MNLVEASVEFSFKGKIYALSAVIELDQCMRSEDPLPEIYRRLAAENGIGVHSYEFDMMIMEPLSFHHASGLAEAFVHDGNFDIEAFRKAWLEQQVIEILKPIAKQYLDIDDLDQHPRIKAALIAAYQAS